MKIVYLLACLIFLFGCFNPNEPNKEKATHKIPVVTGLALTESTDTISPIGFFHADGYPFSYHIINLADCGFLPLPNPIKDSFRLGVNNYWCGCGIPFNFYLRKAVFVLDKENRLTDYLQIGNLNLYAPYDNSIIWLKENYMESGTFYIDFSAKQLKLTPGFYRIYMESQNSISWIDMLYDPDDVIFKRLIKMPHTTLRIYITR